MSQLDLKSARRPDPDQVLVDIATYASEYRVESDLAYETAFHCLMDTLACGFQALKYPACTKLLGPVVPGATMGFGARVPGTSYELDPVQAAFNIGTMIRWLDFNDTWLAAEWGHPSDNLGGILAVADYLSRRAAAETREPMHVRDLLTAMIKAHEIQGVSALENSFNRVGPRPRDSRARRNHGRGHGHARRDEGTDRQCRVECVGRWRRPAHLPPRSEYRLAQELGRR